MRRTTPDTIRMERNQLMKWGKAAAAGGAALGAAALYNAAAAMDAAPVENPLGGEDGTLLWRGHRIAYTRHGFGTPVVLIHGVYAGASAHEWRHIVPALAERHTVLTIDLLGFGRSARPALRYTAALLQAMLGDTIARLVSSPCAVVACSLSAAQMIALAARDPRHIAALALIAPTGVSQLRNAGTAGQIAAQLLIEAPILGTTLYNGLTSAASVRRYLELSYADDRLVTDDWVAAHVRSARQPGGKHAVGAFVGGRLNVDVRGPLRRIGSPMLLLWGEQARQNPIENAHAFRVLTPSAEWALISSAGDLPHDEQPDAVNRILLRFLHRTLGTRPQLRASRVSA